ncbi:Ferredoxin [Sphingomonas guangdongensis]|uniref:Ferredoxin n=1 Tax=Sphingomonas guangdongensis TaxID=1141890 RepID=A0A285R5I9_9SPHN|nr:2Fe-2S iron-sulfur cluster-binding protein [Sphingomonas guangdongensis]SOB87622.1 Ferredoxin [Sphingomonas guangdongensis]
MISVVVEGAGGARTLAAAPGDVLLRVLQAAGEPLEGTCDGQMACATCHVIVTASFDRLPPASGEEEDMLDLAPGASRTSRLSCQVVLAPEMDGMKLRVP